MMRERMIWVVALLLVAGAGFYSGYMLGERNGEQNRQAAAAAFFAQRGGGQGGFAGGQGNSQRNGQGGQNGGQNGGRGFGGGALAGTVSAVNGNTLTLQTRNGQSMTVELASDGKVRKQVDGQLSDITTGEQIVAFGAPDGSTFKATNIQIGALQGAPGGQGTRPAQP